MSSDWDMTPLPAKRSQAKRAAGTRPAARRREVEPMAWDGTTPDRPTPDRPGSSSSPSSTPPQALPVRSEVESVSTGPSGLMLGAGTHGPVAIRLFRRAGTRLALAVPEYVTWLLAYRCISLGAHLSIHAQDPRRWAGLLDAVRAGGGTVDLLAPGDQPPTAGRPYRPSVVIDDANHYDAVQEPIGPWQAQLITTDVSTSSSVFTLRSSEMALVSPLNDKVSENLGRAYALTPGQLRRCQDLAANEVVLAMPRRAVKIAIPPTKLEYQQLFA